MSIPAVVPDLQVSNLTCVGTATLPAASIGDSQITGSGSSAVQASKIQQQRTHPYSQDRNSYNAADWKALELVYGAVGTINALWAKLPVACTGGSTVTVTWRKNGTSVGTVTFIDTDAANAIRTASPSPTSLVTTDDLSVQITVSGGTPGKGIIAIAMTTQYGS